MDGKRHANRWTALLLAVLLTPVGARGQSGELGSDWQTAPPAPLDMGIQRDGLRNVTVPRRGPGDI